MKAPEASDQPTTSSVTGHAEDLAELRVAADYVSGAARGGGNSANEAAQSYRVMVQSIADYQNAVPIPQWPVLVIGIGASLSGAGSTVLLITRAVAVYDVAAAAALWISGGALLILGIHTLSRREELRRRAYFMGRALFNRWASSVGAPHEEVGKYPLKREQERRFQQEREATAGARGRLEE